MFDRKALEHVCDSLIKFAYYAQQALLRFSEMVRAVSAVSTEIDAAAPNSRVKHLAAHGKTARVRKKNMKRILKNMEEG